MPKPIKKQIWNNVDAFALINGIATWDDNYKNLRYVRIPDESNIDLRHKINNFRENKITGSTNNDLVNGLANELNLETYNLDIKTTFDLTRTPFPIIVTDDGSSYLSTSGVQDIFVYYQEPNMSGWTEILPQYWNEDVKNSTPNSGFIVWEDAYFAPTYTDHKSNYYSKLLKVYNNLPNNTKMKIVYGIEQFDVDNNRVYSKFTDMAVIGDDRFIYKTPDVVTSGMLLTNPIVYNLNNIPGELEHMYFDISGRATSYLYNIRNNIDKIYRHRWDSIADRQTIWDINAGFSSGVIPSYYDVEFQTQDINEFINSESGYLTGGVDYYNSALYLKDIDIVTTDKEHWYPVLQPGKFYYNGVSKRLMENPSGIVLDLSAGITPLPNDIKIHHNIIFDTTNTTIVNKYLYDEYDYDIEYVDPNTNNYGQYIPTPTIARKRPYLTQDMGFDLILGLNEYAIDFDNRMIHSNGIGQGVLYFDNTDVPDKVVIQDPRTDLNPINDTSVGFSEYFLTIGE